MKKPTLTLERLAENFDPSEDKLNIAGFKQIELRPDGMKEDYENWTRFYHIGGSTVMLTKEPLGPWMKEGNEPSYKYTGVVARIYSENNKTVELAKKVLIEQGYKLRGKK